MVRKKKRTIHPVSIADRISLVLLTNGPVCCNRVICQHLPDIKKQSVATAVKYGLDHGTFVHHDFALDEVTGYCSRRIALNKSNPAFTALASYV